MMIVARLIFAQTTSSLRLLRLAFFLLRGGGGGGHVLESCDTRTGLARVPLQVAAAWQGRRRVSVMTNPL